MEGTSGERSHEKRAQEIHESPATNLFSLERNPTQPSWTTLKASKNSFRIPASWAARSLRMLKLHPRLFNPPRLSRFRRKILYMCSLSGDWLANFPLSKSSPLLSISFYFSTRVSFFKINPTFINLTQFQLTRFISNKLYYILIFI